VGNLEFGVAQLLWNRFEELHTSADLDTRLSIVSEAAGLDPEGVRVWSTVRIVDYWLWSQSEGFTEDPRRCRQLMRWLQPRFAL
jgi:streptomycin 6-kinase